MKKAIITGIIFLMMVPATFATNEPQPFFEDKHPKAIRSIEINAAVTVVLGQFGNQPTAIEGDEQFMKEIIIKHVGDHLMIRTANNRNLREKGVIYISAESLVELRINSAAYVQSSGTLNVPVIDVLINGACQVILANTGKMNFLPQGPFEIEYKTRETLEPMTFYSSRKN